MQLKNTHWTQENRQDAIHYRKKDLTIEFHQNAAGHRKGDRWAIDHQAVTNVGSVKGVKEKESMPIDLSQAPRFGVFRQSAISLAVGDRIRLTKGGKTREGTRINNGDFFTVTGFTRQGHLKLHTGRTLDKTYGHLDYGYVTTSHSAQGKTVDQVFIAQSSHSLPATSQQQFYVSLSRGRHRCRIYTDDKRQLEAAVKQDNHRMTAREIAQRSRSRSKREWTQESKSAKISKTPHRNGHEQQL